MKCRGKVRHRKTSLDIINKEVNTHNLNKNINFS